MNMSVDEKRRFFTSSVPRLIKLIVSRTFSSPLQELTSCEFVDDTLLRRERRDDEGLYAPAGWTLKTFFFINTLLRRERRDDVGLYAPAGPDLHTDLL